MGTGTKPCFLWECQPHPHFCLPRGWCWEHSQVCGAGLGHQPCWGHTGQGLWGVSPPRRGQLCTLLLCSSRLCHPLLPPMHPPPARAVQGAPLEDWGYPCPPSLPCMALGASSCAASAAVEGDGSTPHGMHTALPGTGQARAPRPTCTDRPGVSLGQPRAGAGSSKAARALSLPGMAAQSCWRSPTRGSSDWGWEWGAA